jgi:Icc-related predicted phosphoesterase
MKFIAISDTHGRHHDLILPPGDVLIHAGDVSTRGIEWEIKDFLMWMEGQDYQYKILIAGNHDFYFERESDSNVREIIPESIIYLNDSGVTIEGCSIWGSPITPWFFNWAFNRHRGEPIKRHWDLIPSDTNILITHGPVFGILDATTRGEHTGCKDLLERVEIIKPTIHICGHIHEAYGQEGKDGIKFINASLLNEKYQLVNDPVIFDL